MNHDISLQVSSGIKIYLSQEQAEQLSAPERIKIALGSDGVLAYDIYLNEQIIGFVMVRNFQVNSWFLWNYAIDLRYQGQGLGYAALKNLIDYMQREYQMIKMTTTYRLGNSQAKGLYEKIGFIETDIVDEEGCREVNMILLL